MFEYPVLENIIWSRPVLNYAAIFKYLFLDKLSINKVSGISFI